MENLNGKTIGEIVGADYRSAIVFNKFKIDFCCKGNRSIEEACLKNSIDPKEVYTSLAELVNIVEMPDETDRMNAAELCDHIEAVHHRYVEEAIQQIKPWLEKIVAVHGGSHPELSEIKTEFLTAAGELAQHMKKEELILFPYIRAMQKSKDSGTPLNPNAFGTVKNPVNMMKHEHSVEGERFERISQISSCYTPPDDACNTYRVTFALLNEFETDLKRHIHLENNILFPLAVKMEQELMEDSSPKSCSIC